MKIKRRIFILLIIIICISTSIFCFANNTKNSNKDEISKQDVTQTNLDNLTIKELKDIRDKDIDENLNDFADLNESEFKTLKNDILNSDYGLVKFIDNKYTKLTEKEKLIKQIKFIEYQNSIKEVLDPSGEYFYLLDQDYQVIEYLVKHKKEPTLNSYENLKFLVDNVQNLSSTVDYDKDSLLEIIRPSNKSNISEKQKKSLQKELEKTI